MALRLADSLTIASRETKRANKREYTRRWRAENRERINEYKRHYRAANRARIDEYGREWYATNRERVKECSRQWYAANRERDNERRRQYYADNAERAKEHARQCRASNPEREKENSRLWRDANPERYSEQQRRGQALRRARKLGAYVEHVDPLVVLELHDGVCGICGEDVDPFDYHVDHIVPLSRGGYHNLTNSQPAHPFCNISKGNRLPQEFKEGYG